jgi:hypothetical protein
MDQIDLNPASSGFGSNLLGRKAWSAEPGLTHWIGFGVHATDVKDM